MIGRVVERPILAGLPLAGLPLAGLVPALWLDASQAQFLAGNADLTGGVAQDQDAVGAWLDRSGNGRHALQTGPTRKPVWRTTLGGLPMIEFDGVDDQLQLGSGLSLNRGISLFAVVRGPAVLAASQAMVISFGSSNGSQLGGGLAILPPGKPRMLTSADGWLAAQAGTVDTQQLAVLSGRWSPSQAQLTFRCQGASPGTASVNLTGSPITTGNQGAIGAIGFPIGTSCYVGAIGEIVVYDRFVSDAFRSRLVQSLRTKWGCA